MEPNSTLRKVAEEVESSETNLEKFTLDYNLINGDPIPLRHTPLTIAILLTAYLSVLVVGIVGNVFVILVVVKMPKMKTATKYFILNLAVADLLVLIFCLLPNLISNIYIPWTMGSFMCKAVPYVQGMSVCASAYSLAAISADRFMAVRSSPRHQITTTVARRIILSIWMWAAGLALPWLFYFDLTTLDMREPSLVFCIDSWPSRMLGNIYFVVVNLGLFYLFPLSFISFCHLTVWLRVRIPWINTNAPMSPRQTVRRRANASVQKLVVAVVIGFAVCWLPLYIIFVRVKLIPVVLGATEEKVLDYALPIAQWLGASNSCINPILYAFFNRHFRFTLQRLLRACAAHIGPRNRLHSQHNNQANRGAQLRSNLDRLRIAFQRSYLKNRELRNSTRDAVHSGESSWVMFHEKSPKSAGITRSQTYKAAMGNPWENVPR